MVALNSVFPGGASGRSLSILAVIGMMCIAGQVLGQEHMQHGESAAHRVFDDPAAYTDSWDDPARDAWQRPADLVVALGVQPGMAVADIGTGTGYMLPHLSRAVGATGQVYAVDVSSEMLSWVDERAEELRYRSYDQGHIDDIEERVEQRDQSVRPADERD